MFHVTCLAYHIGQDKTVQRFFKAIVYTSGSMLNWLLFWYIFNDLFSKN